MKPLIQQNKIVALSGSGESAGPSNVIHVHRQLAYARGTSEAQRRYRIDRDSISIGQPCEDGTQRRPDSAWFGEQVQFLEEARKHVATAARVLVVGTSLTIYPAGSLVKAARGRAEKVLVGIDVENMPYGFRYLRGKATGLVPSIAARWLREAT